KLEATSSPLSNSTGKKDRNGGAGHEQCEGHVRTHRANSNAKAYHSRDFNIVLLQGISRDRCAAARRVSLRFARLPTGILWGFDDLVLRLARARRRDRRRAVSSAIRWLSFQQSRSR